MARHIIPNQWTLAWLKDRVGVLQRPWPWRLCEPAVYGQVCGLPGSLGVAVATNGVLVAIVQQERVFIGHLASFEACEQNAGAEPLATMAIGAAVPVVAVKSRKRQKKNESSVEFV